MTKTNPVSRRKFLKTSALAAGAATVGTVAMPQVSRAQTTTLKMQGSWGAKDVFNEMALDYVERVNKMVDELFNAQASIAQGVSYLYRIDKDDKGHDKPAVIETDPNVIKDYIDGKLDDADSYYYITTERPDNRALDSMLNRAFGKPEEKIDITTDGKRIQQPAVISTIAPRHAVPETDPTESD